MKNLYEQMDFVLSGGALQLLTDFLASRVTSALILEPRDTDLYIVDAVGTGSDELVFKGLTPSLDELFSQKPFVSSCELEQVSLTGHLSLAEEWPWGIRMRGHNGKTFLLLKEKPDDALMEELLPYAGLLRLWRVFQKIDAREAELARLSYMILATKSTLASIFEPMPLEYYATFLADVLRESLFPRSVAILLDGADGLAFLEGDTRDLPPREGIFAQKILPASPVMMDTGGDASRYQVVLPIVESDIRLFCILEWSYQPDEGMLNFLELLGSLATRSLAINSLRVENMLATSQITSGDFTIMSLSSVLGSLRSEEDRKSFLSLVADIFLEVGQMSDCILVAWDEKVKGYAMAEYRVNGIKMPLTSPPLITNDPLRVRQLRSTPIDLQTTDVSELLRSWGAVVEVHWMGMNTMRYFFPLQDGKRLEGFIALAPGSHPPLGETQRAALRIVAQFVAYEFRRFRFAV